MREPALNVPGDAVLVISADTERRARFLDYLCIAGLRPRGATSGGEALRLMALHRFDGVIADADLPDMTSERLADEIRADVIHAEAVITLTGRTAPVLVIAELTDALASRATRQLAATVAALSAGTSGSARSTT